jgi:hypothetical protein
VGIVLWGDTRQDIRLVQLIYAHPFALVRAKQVKFIVQKAPQLVWPGVELANFNHVVEPDCHVPSNPLPPTYLSSA